MKLAIPALVALTLAWPASAQPVPEEPMAAALPAALQTQPAAEMPQPDAAMPQPAMAMPQPANNPQELIDMEAAWAKAMVARDSAALAQIVAPDWQGQNERGKIYDRAAMIHEMTTGEEKLTSMVNHDVHVRFLGDDHAIVQGMDNESSIKAGKPVNKVYSWTDFYEKRDGKWVAIASQNTPVK